MEERAALIAPESDTISAFGALRSTKRSDHQVLFYESDDDLIRELQSAAVAVLGDDGRLLVVATPAHRAALRAVLPPRTLLRAEREGRLITLDAAHTLTTIMSGDRPSPALFERVVGDLVRAQLATGGGFCAYGEMVALLWERTNIAGALELEQLWNGLQAQADFQLICAYPYARARTAGNNGFRQICERHTASHRARLIRGLPAPPPMRNAGGGGDLASHVVLDVQHRHDSGCRCSPLF